MLGNWVLKMGVGLAIFLSAGIAAMAGAVTVKSVDVDARIMKFPRISLDGIAYDALTFEYGTRGSVEVMAVNAAMETLQCNGQAQQNHYLAIDYRGPGVIFRITDQKKNRVLHLQQLNTDGTYAFGQGICDDNKDLKARFDREKSSWYAEMNKRLLAAARAQMEEYIQQETALSYEDLRFPLFYFSADGARFENLNQAFDRAREAFDLSVQFGITKEAEDMLKLVAATWEKELAVLLDDKNQSHAESIKLALHRNLSSVYLFTRKYDLAMRHDALAISQGMHKDESLQKRILEHERRTILSPQVAGDVVLTANLYRYGQNAIRDARLVEVEDFSDLKRALSQR